MELNELRELIVHELPRLIKIDPSIRDYVLEICRPEFPDKRDTETKFDRMFRELREARELDEKKWDEHMRESVAHRIALKEKWDKESLESAAKWATWEEKWEEHLRESAATRAAQEKKWEEHLRESAATRAAQEKKWEEHLRESAATRAAQEKKWEESDRRWEELKRESAHQSAESDGTHEDTSEKKLDRSIKRLESTLGAIGARWGHQTEESYRSGLAAILKDVFDGEVVHVNEYDEEGIVFGRPDQVELDVVVKNGLLIICELKSSLSKSDMYAFERKVRYYEKKHRKQAPRMIAISPMVDERAMKVAPKLGIEVFSHADAVASPEDEADET
ncbi:MAG: DUF3782 domain-containing protein [Deltaproteobacteria bacterium]|nr:DUF3782 domain-containing protein [Deltaproteobacteria bacterium]